MAMASAEPQHPELAGDAPGAMLPRPFRVIERRRDLAHTVTLTLLPDAAAGASPEAWRGSPGQFNMLYTFGVGEVPISVAGHVPETGALLHTIRAVGRTTEALCAAREDDVVGVRGPFGTAWPMDFLRGRDVVLIAGGIGLAPLRPVVQAVLAERAAYGRLVVLYGTRTPEEILYRDELQAWVELPHVDVQVTVDRARSEDAWTGRVGVVPRLLRQARFDPIDTAVLICGPEVMLEPCARELLSRGLSLEQIFVSLERNMHCAIGICGHCQLGPRFICRDGPVFPLPAVESLLRVAEL